MEIAARVYLWGILMMMVVGVKGWTGEINGRVVCDVCGDASIGPEDHVLQGLTILKLNFLFPSCDFLYVVSYYMFLLLYAIFCLSLVIWFGFNE